MARGKRSEPVLTMREQIHKQGVITMLTTVADSAMVSSSDPDEQLRAEFVNWLSSDSPEVFQRLVGEFAMSKVEELREEEGNVHK